MRKFFDLTNPFWQMMSLFSDFILLSLIWILAVLPIFTFGPATVALFSVGFHLNDNSGQGVWQEFINSFLRKFKSTIWLGLAVLLLSFVILVDLIYYRSVHLPIATFWLFVFLFMGVLFICFLLYLFPLLALYDWKMKRLFSVAFVAMIRNFQWTLFLFTVNGAIVILTLYIAPYLVFFTIGGLAWLNMKVILLLVERGLLPHGSC